MTEDTIKMINDALDALTRSLQELQREIAECNTMRHIYPPYRERLRVRKDYRKKTCWHRIRSNPFRRRKPH